MTYTPLIGIVDPEFLRAEAEGRLQELGAGVKRTIVVTGAPRTGTSMVAGLLSLSGLYMGANLQGAGPHNERGLYEDEKFVKLNDIILMGASGSWLTPPPSGNFDVVRNDVMYHMVQYEQREVWGVKDGRFCLTLPTWMEVFDQLNVHFVVCHRNSLSVAQSLARWWPIDVQHGLWLAAEYNRRLMDVLRVRREWPVLHLSYEAFLADPQTHAAELARFTGVTIDADLVAQFVEPRLKRY